MGRQTKSLIFVSQRLRQPVGEEKKGEKKRKRMKKRRKKKEKEKKVCFHLEIKCILMSRVIGVIARVFPWRLVCSKPRVLVERSHKPLIC